MNWKKFVKSNYDSRLREYVAYCQQHGVDYTDGHSTVYFPHKKKEVIEW